MPDISMCDNVVCPLQTTCYRHEMSGTAPSPMRQAWMSFAPDKNGSCKDYIAVERRDAAKPVRRRNAV